MNTQVKGRTAEASPRFQARIAAVFYLVTIVMGGVVLLVQSRLGLAGDLIVSTCYVAVTGLFYRLSR
jgi:hypothetical protein